MLAIDDYGKGEERSRECEISECYLKERTMINEFYLKD